MSEPVGLWTASAAAPADAPNLRARRFEYSSRGDRVPGLLLLPAEGEGPFPLVLLQHGAGGSKDAAYLDAARLPWVQRGVAVASIDFPLHGERASAKLSEQLLAATVAVRAIRPRGHDRAVERIRAAGGADLGARSTRSPRSPSWMRSASPTPASASARSSARSSAPTDPRAARRRARARRRRHRPAATSIRPRTSARFAPRPLLFVNATRDERIPRAAAEALHAAAREPKEIAWFECGHTRPARPRGLKAMWSFLAQTPRNSR